MFSIKCRNISTALVLTIPFSRNVQAKSPTMGPSMNIGSQFGDNINASLKVGKVIWPKMMLDDETSETCLIFWKPPERPGSVEPWDE